MTISRRDNSYWLDRLKKDGHHDILVRVQSGEISMYEARGLAGYRKDAPPSVGAKLSYHWQRASPQERKKFIAAHPLELDRVLKEFVQERRLLKEKKPN